LENSEKGRVRRSAKSRHVRVGLFNRLLANGAFTKRGTVFCSLPYTLEANEGFLAVEWADFLELLPARPGEALKMLGEGWNEKQWQEGLNRIRKQESSA